MHAREVCNLSVPCLAIDIEAVVLPSTPCLLSVGARCMEEEFTFVWKPKRPPYFVTPEGRRIQCEVHNRCPYLMADAHTCAATMCDGDRASVDSEAATSVEPCDMKRSACDPIEEDDRVLETSRECCPQAQAWESVISDENS